MALNSMWRTKAGFFWTAWCTAWPQAGPCCSGTTPEKPPPPLCCAYPAPAPPPWEDDAAPPSPGPVRAEEGGAGGVQAASWVREVHGAMTDSHSVSTGVSAEDEGGGQWLSVRLNEKWGDGRGWERAVGERAPEHSNWGTVAGDENGREWAETAG